MPDLWSMGVYAALKWFPFHREKAPFGWTLQPCVYGYYYCGYRHRFFVDVNVVATKKKKAEIVAELAVLINIFEV